MKKSLSVVCLLLALSSPVHATIRMDCHVVQMLTFAAGLLQITGGFGTLLAAYLSSDLLVPGCEKKDQANCCLAPAPNSTQPQNCISSKKTSGDCADGQLFLCKRGEGYVDPILREPTWIHPMLMLGTVLECTGFLTMFVGCRNLCRVGNSPSGALTMHGV